MSAEERPKVILVNRCFVQRQDGKWLIIKRSPNDTNNPGKWEPPGGKVDVGQLLLGAQEREVLEETGLVAESVHRMVYIYDFQITMGRYKDFLYLAFFHLTRLLGGVLRLSDEHTEHAWVTYDEMLEYDLTLEVRKAAIMLKEHLTQPAPASA